MLKWAIGLTTIPARRKDLLPRTLESVRAAGWSELRLFVDGCTHAEAASYEEEFNLPVTARYPKVLPYPNFILSLAELFMREPMADLYFLGQDDFLTYRNLRAYLEQSKLPPRSYINCISFMANHKVVHGQPPGTWHEASLLNPGDPRRLQTGRGAVALVFSREAVITLLSHQDAAKVMVERRLHPERGWRYADGGVVEAMNKAGWREYVHAPSLVTHIGLTSSFDKTFQSKGDAKHHPIYQWPDKRVAHSFLGETFDALSFLQ